MHGGGQDARVSVVIGMGHWLFEGLHASLGFDSYRRLYANRLSEANFFSKIYQALLVAFWLCGRGLCVVKIFCGLGVGQAWTLATPTGRKVVQWGMGVDQSRLVSAKNY